MYLNQALKNPIFKTIAFCGGELGMPCYVVGGFVRDFILKRNTIKDIDILAIGNAIELAQKVAEKLPNKTKINVFKTYGTAMLRFNKIELEFVTARKESYRSESRNPEISKGSLEDDQKRRDFTINSLAVSLNKSDYGRLLDPFSGIDDIKNKLIVTPHDPNITFKDDPLRMLRAIRFSTQLNFKINQFELKSIKKKDSLSI